MHWILTPKPSPANPQARHVEPSAQSPAALLDQPLRLHPQFDWIDEFAWQAAVISEPIYSITGAMIVETGIKQAGRPITLAGHHAHITRAELNQLLAWAQAPGVFSLACPDGRRFDVMFARQALRDISALQPYRLIDKSDSDLYRATLAFLTV